jgi:hypothetical protein
MPLISLFSAVSMVPATSAIILLKLIIVVLCLEKSAFLRYLWFPAGATTLGITTASILTLSMTLSIKIIKRYTRHK